MPGKGWGCEHLSVREPQAGRIKTKRGIDGATIGVRSVAAQCLLATTSRCQGCCRKVLGLTDSSRTNASMPQLVVGIRTNGLEALKTTPRLTKLPPRRPTSLAMNFEEGHEETQLGCPLTFSSELKSVLFYYVIGPECRQISRYPAVSQSLVCTH
ncbi:hypothetical protein M433DRAFT_302344 [Acidomyces richmondensis BFW]|nr:MAG: hypothetical protein FE78DRAFT_453815 [Acidomyces sp. 'richmondensis']KYG44466.1 hypothetical protein M433DRAFT_302344 [Acidomyces richmondensis BFW]